ncbi:hypothetical protein FWH58_01885 [Candidatus Saccharibacteria bacterium]|nr:hypothetical protein [Candidatus Saccharibacteria bacterium]
MAKVKELKLSEIIAKYKAIYQKINRVQSPAIGDYVYFNMFGFKHLIFKGHHRRDNLAVYNRLVLIPLIAPVIKNCDREVEIRIRRETVRGKEVKVTYYALESRVGTGSVRVRVVTRQIGDKGRHYFQSIMKY